MRAAEDLWRALGPATPAPASRPPRKSPRRLGAIAGLLILGVVSLGGGMAGPPTGLGSPAGLWADLGLPAGLWPDYATGTGGHQSVTLADGSRLEIGARTRLDVEFSGDRRRLVLHEGEIHGSVAPDPQRPFDVTAAGGMTRALGTGFDVRRDGTAVRIAVTEHAVRVAYPGTNPAAAAAEVAAGKLVRYRPETGLSAVMDADLRSLTAWRRSRLIFDGLPLAEVVAELSGVVLYGPYMRRLAFGSLRRTRDRRGRWLDLHNLLGIVTLLWALMVGGTGGLGSGLYLWVRRRRAPAEDHEPAIVARRS